MVISGGYAILVSDACCGNTGADTVQEFWLQNFRELIEPWTTLAWLAQFAVNALKDCLRHTQSTVSAFSHRFCMTPCNDSGFVFKYSSYGLLAQRPKFSNLNDRIVFLIG